MGIPSEEDNSYSYLGKEIILAHSWSPQTELPVRAALPRVPGPKARALTSADASCASDKQATSYLKATAVLVRRQVKWQGNPSTIRLFIYYIFLDHYWEAEDRAFLRKACMGVLQFFIFTSILNGVTVPGSLPSTTGIKTTGYYNKKQRKLWYFKLFLSLCKKSTKTLGRLYFVLAEWLTKFPFHLSFSVYYRH